jgi:ribonuclease HII
MIDGRDVPLQLTDIGEAFIKGDARSLSIAAASVIAKVVRDRMMVEADKHYPEYGFAGHKGYGSKKHRDAILKYGGSPLHRKSFSPLKQMLENVT